MIENILQNGLSDNNEIKFGHYGFFFKFIIEGYQKKR